MDKKLLDDRAGLITGATQGVGKAAALLFASEGAKVVVSGRNEKNGQAVVDEILANGGIACFKKCDVSDEQQVKELVDFTYETYGSIDWAFNNSGIITPEPYPIQDTSTEWVERTWRINVMGLYFAMKYEIPYMIKAGKGAIVNTCSINSVVSTIAGTAYGTSKFGAYGLTQAAALDNAANNIRVNAIGPGPTATPMILDGAAKTNPELIAYLEQSTPDGRMATPEECANAALYLLSDYSTHINAQLLFVDGGKHAMM